MTHRSLFCYAWDLQEHSAAAIADQFQRWHINAITLAGSYHAGKFIRPHGKLGKVYFPEDGTVYFRVDPDRYGAIKPVENSLLDTFDAFDVYSQQDSLPLTAWMVLMHNSRVGQLYPDACVRNAFGDRYHYNLCPANAVSQEYAVALCGDIAERYPITGMTLESPGYLPYAHGYHHEFALVRQNSWLNNNMGLCFCQHCVSQATDAGIDASGLQQRVRTRLENYLAGDVDYTDDMAAAFWVADLVTDPDLTEFLRFRCKVVTDMVKSIKEAMRSDLTLSVIPSVARPTSGAWYEGSDLKQLAGIADHIEACFYESGVDRISGDLCDIQSRIGTGKSLRAILRPGHPDLNSRQSVIDAVSFLVQNGIDDLSFYNYGHLPQRSLNWMGEALGQSEVRT